MQKLFNANKVPTTYLTAVGRVLNQWSRLEWTIEACCKTILQIGAKESRLVFSQMNTRAKIECFKALVGRYLPNGGYKTLALQIAKNAEKANSVRNKIVHGHWVHPKGKPRKLLLYYVGGSSDNRLVPEPYKANAKMLNEFAQAVSVQHQHASVLLLILQSAPRASTGIYELRSGPPHPRPSGNPSNGDTPPQAFEPLP